MLGAFHASGSTDYLEKLISHLSFFDERTDLERFGAGATAKWSLACHVRSDRIVRDYVLATMPSRNGRTQSLLGEILTMEPSTIQEENRRIWECEIKPSSRN